MPFLALSVVLSLICAASLSAQIRLSDKDVLQHTKNLKDDTQKFRSSFNSALSKSTIRKTTQEKDAKTLAQNFKKQTNSMYEAFRKAPRPNRTCRIAATLRGRSTNHDQHPDGPAANTQWSTVKTELNTRAQAFHVSRL